MDRRRKEHSILFPQQQVLVDIVETTAQSLQGSIDIEGMKNDAIAGTTIRATVTLRNIGNKEFADDVYFIVYPRDDFSAVTQQVRRIRLSAGESALWSREENRPLRMAD